MPSTIDTILKFQFSRKLSENNFCSSYNIAHKGQKKLSKIKKLMLITIIIKASIRDKLEKISSKVRENEK